MNNKQIIDKIVNDTKHNFGFTLHDLIDLIPDENFESILISSMIYIGCESIVPLLLELSYKDAKKEIKNIMYAFNEVFFKVYEDFSKQKNTIKMIN